MRTPRYTSLDSVFIPEWKWSPFLENIIDLLSNFNLEPYPVPLEFLEKEETFTF